MKNDDDDCILPTLTGLADQGFPKRLIASLEDTCC